MATLTSCTVKHPILVHTGCGAVDLYRDASMRRTGLVCSQCGHDFTEEYFERLNPESLMLDNDAMQAMGLEWQHPKGK